MLDTMLTPLASSFSPIRYFASTASLEPRDDQKLQQLIDELSTLRKFQA